MSAGSAWRRLVNTASGQGGTEARTEADSIAAASAPKGCPSCGRIFGSPGAFALAHDGRCLPDHMIESTLIEVSGVWVTRGSDAAQR